MMTEKASKIFSEILDLNWEMNRENKDFTRKFDLAKQLGDKKAELKKEMGEVEYNKFMDAGTKMFAPLTPGRKVSDDGDEFEELDE